MRLEEYIRACIGDYLNSNNITADDDEITSILTEVLSGSYAFQIIYTSKIQINVIGFAYSEDYTFIKYKILDHTIMSFSEGDDTITPHWIYKRENHNSIYAEHEILFIDKNIIRDIKLEFELNI